MITSSVERCCCLCLYLLTYLLASLWVSTAEFPLHDAWNSHVVISAQLYGPDGIEKNSWLAVATEYSSFKTRQVRARLSLLSIL